MYYLYKKVRPPGLAQVVGAQNLRKEVF